MAAVEVSGLVRAPLEAVWAWWTDFGQPGDSDVVDHGAAKSRRFVTSRDGQWLTLEERTTWGAGRGILTVRHRVRVVPDRHEIDEEVLFPARSASTWRFTPDAGGTRITRVMPRTFALEKLVPTFLQRDTAQKDLDAHVRQANREIGS